MEHPLRRVGRGVVVLVAVARVVEDRLVDVVERDVRADMAPRIVVGSLAPGFQRDAAAGHQLLDDVGAAVGGARRIAVGGAHQAAAYGDAVELDALHADRRRGVAEVEEGARRAHRAERTGRDDVHAPDDLGGRKGARQLGHLFGGQDDGFALTDLFVDLFVTLLHGEILVRSAKYAEIATFQNPRRTAAAPDKAKETTLSEGRLFRCGSRTDQIAPPIRKTAATVRMAYSSGNAARISVLPITSWPLPIAVIPLAQTFDWK